MAKNSDMQNKGTNGTNEAGMKDCHNSTKNAQNSASQNKAKNASSQNNAKNASSQNSTKNNAKNASSSDSTDSYGR